MSNVAPLRFSLPSPPEPPRDMTPDDDVLMLHATYHDVSTFDMTRGCPVDAPQNSVLPTVMEAAHPDDMVPASFPALLDGSHGTFGDNGASSDTLNAPCQRTDSPPPTSFLSPGVHDTGLYLTGPNDRPPLLRTSHATNFPLASPPDNQNVTEPDISRSLPSHPSPGPSPGPSSPPFLPYPSLTGSLGSIPRFRVIPPPHPAALSRRRQSARAIYHGGVWLDEQELLTALKEPNGVLHVFRCRLEEDHSPCHLWIKGDKSAINAHMQRWHGVKPGGDKSKINCRWSACRKKMLKESITRHIVRAHLGETWECLGCQKRTTRNDVHNRHTLRSDIEACRMSGALTTYSVDVMVVHAQAALEDGGQVRNVDA